MNRWKSLLLSLPPAVLTGGVNCFLNSLLEKNVGGKSFYSCFLRILCDDTQSPAWLCRRCLRAPQLPQNGGDGEMEQLRTEMKIIKLAVLNEGRDGLCGA